MLSPEEIQIFLERTVPALLGVVGTLDKQGFPHTVPVWYKFDGSTVQIWTAIKRGWVKNLIRDSRASFAVYEQAMPFAAVVMKRHASVKIGGGSLPGQIHRITRRYVPASEVASYMKEWENLRTIVTFTPEKVVAWGRGY